MSVTRSIVLKGVLMHNVIQVYFGMALMLPRLRGRRLCRRWIVNKHHTGTILYYTGTTQKRPTRHKNKTNKRRTSCASL